MLLSELIASYKDKLAHFEREFAQYSQITQVELPSVTKQISNIENAICNARSSVRNALTADNLKKAKAELSQLECSLADLEQLKSNLNLKAEQFKGKRPQLEAEVKTARREMWQQKHDELLASLKLPDETLELLSLVIAAKDGTNPGWVSLQFSDPVREKFGSMEKEQLADYKSRLATEMDLPVTEHVF